MRPAGTTAAHYGALQLVGLAGLSVALQWGLVARVLEADASGICALIAGVYILAASVGGYRAAWLSRELDRPTTSSCADAYRAGRRAGLHHEACIAIVRERLAAKIALPTMLGGVMVTLGLIGTVVGFIMALSGVDGAGLSADTVAPMVGGLIEGMGVALYTTLVGAISATWNILGVHVLRTGASTLLRRLPHVVQ